MSRIRSAWSKVMASSGKCSGLSKNDDSIFWTSSADACQFETFRRSPSRREELGREEGRSDLFQPDEANPRDGVTFYELRPEVVRQMWLNDFRRDPII